MEETTRVIPTMAEFQALAARLGAAKRAAKAAYDKRNELLRARNKAIETLPEDVAYRSADESWYELEDAKDELEKKWNKAVDALGMGDDDE